MKKIKRLLIVKIVEFMVIITCMLLMGKGCISGVFPAVIIFGSLILGLCYDVFLIVYVLKFRRGSKE